MLQQFITDFTTLIVTISPVSIVPVFLGLTGGMTPAERRRVAFRACVIATGILLFFLVMGQFVMEAIGISLPAFRLAGGLILLTIGLRMVSGDAPSARNPDKEHQDITVFPLATPTLAGGGSITAIVVLTDNYVFTIAQQAGTALTMVLVMAICFLTLVCAGPIQRLIGETGTNVVGRIMGLILAALAMQTLVTAVKAIMAPGMLQ